MKIKIDLYDAILKTILNNNCKYEKEEVLTDEEYKERMQALSDLSQ